MTPAERAALRELVAKATPGPWSFDVDQLDVYQPLVDRGKKVFGVHSYRLDDMQFICAARSAIPQLLDDVERLEREVESYAVRCAELGRDYELWELDFRQRVLAICEQADRDSATPGWIADEVRELDADDAQARKEGGG